MNDTTQRVGSASSIRTRFLLVVLFGAVVPLALIGVWLTRSVVRAGEDLLHSDLDQSLQKIADAVEARWSYRHGDLALLAANDVAQRLLAAGPPQKMAAADSIYLAQLFTSMSQAIPSFEYRDASGALRWSSPARRPDTTDARGARVLAPPIGPTLTIAFPVRAASGTAPLGTMVARASINDLIPTDTALRLPKGAKLQVVQSEGRVALMPSFAPDSLLPRERFVLAGGEWIAVHRIIESPAIELHLVAPLTAYVQPFERAAHAGAITLAIVSLLVLLFTVFVTRRLTGSLQRLAVAADAVAGGDLDHHVEAGTNDEVGRVGAAFNSMVANLRRTLGELATRQALAAVGEYAASLSHEVRNGLTAVRVDLQRAEEKITDGMPGRALVARALENVKRLDGSVTASLRVARGTRTPRRRLDVRPVLQAAGRAAEAAFSERGAIMHRLAPDGAPAWVLGDAMALEQLFVNLLVNSAQALQRDGTAAVTVDVDGADVRILVRDTGAGIRAEDMENVLEPFFSTKENGTGLGLSVARQIANAHGGSLKIESVPGLGTKVEVRLPLAAAPTATVSSL